MRDWRVLLVAVAAIFLLAPPAAVPPEPETFAALVRTVLPSVVNISVKGKGQGRGNNGIGLMGARYEIQVLDSYQNPTYPEGSAASVTSGRWRGG